MVIRLDRSKLNAITKAKKLFVRETGLRICAIDSQISFLALGIASKKIQNCQWNLRKVVAIWRSQWNLGFSNSFNEGPILIFINPTPTLMAFTGVTNATNLLVLFSSMHNHR